MNGSRKLTDSGTGRAPRKRASRHLPEAAEQQGGAPTAVDAAEQLIRPLAWRSMFMRPGYLSDSAWLEHIPFAFWVVEAHQPRMLVELGTHHGASYFAFCQAVERLGLESRCFAIDTWKGDEHAGFYDEDVFERVSAYNDAQYSSFSRLVRSTFDEAVDHFSDGTVDLLHIDGLHTLEAVRRDFKTWLPKLSDRGLVLLHDSNVRERRFGVFRLVEELRETYPCFEFTHGHGLAVLGVGPHQTDTLGKLFEADKDEAARHAIQEIFARLGRACADARLAEAERARVAELGRSVENHKIEMERLRDVLEATRGDVRDRVKELNEARANMQSQAQRHAAQESRLSERTSLLEELRRELKQEVQRLTKRQDELTAERREQARELQQARRELTAEKQARTRAESVAEERAREVARLGRELEALRRKAAEEVKAEKAVASRLANEKETLSTDVQARVAELAELTQMLRETEQQRDKSDARIRELEEERGRAEHRRALSEGEIRRSVARLLRKAVVAGAGYPSEAPLNGRALRKLAGILRGAGLMNDAWYLGRNDDVAKAGNDPAEHYLLYGWSEGREPFDVAPPSSGDAAAAETAPPPDDKQQ